RVLEYGSEQTIDSQCSEALRSEQVLLCQRGWPRCDGSFDALAGLAIGLDQFQACRNELTRATPRIGERSNEVLPHKPVVVARSDSHQVNEQRFRGGCLFGL